MRSSASDSVVMADDGVAVRNAVPPTPRDASRRRAALVLSPLRLSASRALIAENIACCSRVAGGGGTRAPWPTTSLRTDVRRARACASASEGSRDQCRRRRGRCGCALRCTALHDAVLHGAARRCTARRCTALHCTALRCGKLRSTRSRARAPDADDLLTFMAFCMRGWLSNYHNTESTKVVEDVVAALRNVLRALVGGPRPRSPRPRSSTMRDASGS